jgi:hypothetical protein
MLVTSLVARTTLLLTLTALATALMLVRFMVDQQQGAATRTAPSVSLAGHTPGSTAHERREYRLRLAAAAVATRN